MGNEQKIKRGDVWYVSFDNAFGCEEKTGRPAIVMTADEYLPVASVVTVVYLSTVPKGQGSHVEITSGNRRGFALCEQLTCVDIRRLKNYKCSITAAEMSKVELGIRRALALPVKVDEGVEKIGKLETELKEWMEVASGLEEDLTTQKKAYDRLMDKYVDLRIEKDFDVKMKGYGETKWLKPDFEEKEPEVTVTIAPEPELDLSGLQEKFKVHDQKKKKADSPKKETHPVAAKPPIGCPKLNINLATKEDLVAVGIGKQTASNIVKYREKKGKYSTVSDLLNVDRFGPVLLKNYEKVFEV